MSLPKWSVVAALELVLDDDGLTRFVFGYQIDVERSGGLLSLGGGGIDFEHLVQHVEVVL